MRANVSLIVLGCILSTAAHAGAQELSRVRAKTLISEDARFKGARYVEVDWRVGGYEEWVAEGALHNAVLATLVNAPLTTARTLSLSVPYQLQVDAVTGITSPPIGQGLREVHFTWTSTGISEVLQPMVCWRGTGQAMMRLFDDGWRLEEITGWRPECASPSLSPIQRRRAEQFKTAERARVAAAASAELEARLERERAVAENQRRLADEAQRKAAAAEAARQKVERELQDDQKSMDEWGVAKKWASRLYQLQKSPKPIRQVNRAEYTSDAFKKRIQGNVEVQAIIDGNGKVTACRVVKSLDPGLDESAIAAARKWTFEPRTIDGQPVPGIVTLEFTFSAR